MAKTRSAKQQIKVNERNRQRNVAVKSRVKTFTKKAEDAIEAQDADKIKEALPVALSEIDRAACKGIIHPNTAARKKSQLQRKAGAAL